MARKTTNKYFLVENEGPIEGEGCPIESHNNKYLMAYGDFTEVRIDILAGNRPEDGVAPVWVPIQDGLFEAPEARLLLGIPKSCTLRAVVTGGTSTTVELTK